MWSVQEVELITQSLRQFITHPDIHGAHMMTPEFGRQPELMMLAIKESIKQLA